MELFNAIPDNFKEDSATEEEVFCLNETIIFILKAIHPIAPHISEYLWQGFAQNILNENIDSSWPKFDSKLMEASGFQLVVQINGKVRGKISLDKGLDQKEIEEAAKSIENIRNNIEGKEIRKVIYIKEKIINFVL
jgi:leucyl-tRNA synthetase